MAFGCRRAKALRRALPSVSRIVNFSLHCSLRRPRVRAKACFKSSSAISGRVAAMRAAAIGSGAGGLVRWPRRSGACCSLTRATARQPRNWLTRSQITFVRCWISIAAGPSTRSTSVPGSCVRSDRSPPAREEGEGAGRVHWIFIGSLLAADVLADDGGPVRHQFGRSKPLLLEGFADDLAGDIPQLLGENSTGLVHGAALCHPSAAMTVAAKATRQQRGKSRAAPSLPEPTALLDWYDRHRRVLPWRAAPGQRGDPIGCGFPKSCCSRRR